LKEAAASFTVVTLTGPRQSGKTTLCRAEFPDKVYANLEAPDTRAFALDDPRGFLAQFPDGAVLDEIQRAPELLSYLQVLVDENPLPGRWILTGSQNLAMMDSVNQSLAGRTAVLRLLPMSFDEMTEFANAPQTLNEVLFTGGYPRILDQNIPASDWLASYVSTYIERDVRQLSKVGDLNTFQKFVALCAGRTGQLLNYSNLAADCGITQPTAKKWLSILEASYLVFLQPNWSGNHRKRLVKMPKLHFLDVGLACWLLGIRAPEHLEAHPLRGALFETWVATEVWKHRLHRGISGPLNFYRDKTGLEADILIQESEYTLLAEAKAGQTVASDSFKPLNRVAATLEESSSLRKVLVYGGEELQERTDVLLLPWRQVQSGPWS
jgi:hypothetical protein